MKEHQIPGYKIVEDKIREIDKEISIERVDPDSSRMSRKFHLIKEGRKYGVVFSDEFLDDLNDFSGSKTSGYWKRMESSLTSALLAPIEKQGLIPFAKEKQKELIFEHVKKTLQSTQHINKFNLLGRPYQEGSLERFIGVKFTEKERAAAGSAFDELSSLGVGFKSATEPFDTTTSAGKLMLQQLGSFAEFERNRITERVFSGMVKGVQ